MSRHVRTIGRNARKSAPFSAVFACLAFGLEHCVPGAWLLLALFALKIVSGTILHTLGGRHACGAPCVDTHAAPVADVSAPVLAACAA